MAAFNAALQRDGLPTVAVGIGINTGQAVVGYVGLGERLSALQLAGALVILAGVLMINWPARGSMTPS